ncbi:MAG TPA: peptide chain release factor N(5)-glutamine methyltransferase [Dokdonella sp.]|uniref:peptide chain release factor N(5)-glutamine methyltransferase n=1 Tax=Dokdonella sp. TaxID=2291710 RepID=UPI002D7EE171|nr:peptide chain release factor N(5)-glutamine methyltransferase [Dokdonella sp.]HET9032232.1 peptide chain release factor N(5)-glutamine methyltransferase [Dokdonella sp.]
MDTEFAKRHARLKATFETPVDKPDESPEATLRVLWWLAAGESRSLNSARATLPELDSEALDRLDALINRRLSGQPLAHLSGRQDFCGLELLATASALVPRRETELLARAAIALANELGSAQDHIQVLDVCTGSGNVALAIAEHCPAARVFGADIDKAAIELARANARQLGLEARVDFRSGDLLAPFEQTEFLQAIDLLTCNPPYISSAKVEQMPSEISAHEPRLAFDGGPLGVSILMRLIDEAPRWLRRGGWLAFEVGLGQGRSLARRLERHADYDEIREIHDAEGATRVVLAQRRAKEESRAET